MPLPTLRPAPRVYPDPTPSDDVQEAWELIIARWRELADTSLSVSGRLYCLLQAANCRALARHYGSRA